MTPTHPVFPTEPEDLTPHILTAALGQRWPGIVVQHVEIVDVKRCGDGVASTADRVVLELTYGSTSGSLGGQELPTRMILKTMLATPHAPAAMYENEVRFYSELRAEVDIEAPSAFASLFDPETGRFGLLLEDLGARQARFPSAIEVVSLAEVRSILSHLATLHGRFWNSPRFDGDLAWVATPMSGGMFEVFDLIGLELIEDQVARYPFKQRLIAPVGRSVAQMWELLWKVQRRHCEHPTTLLHGDPHLGNTYLLPGDRGGLLDWQLMMRGSWAHDVVYLLMTSLELDVRRAHEMDLLAEYLDLLGRAGGDAPTLDDAFERCRAAALWGLVIGWLICPPENYGQPITEANISRAVAAVMDYDTIGMIERWV